MDSMWSLPPSSPTSAALPKEPLTDLISAEEAERRGLEWIKVLRGARQWDRGTSQPTGSGYTSTVKVVEYYELSAKDARFAINDPMRLRPTSRTRGERALQAMGRLQKSELLTSINMGEAWHDLKSILSPLPEDLDPRLRGTARALRNMPGELNDISAISGDDQGYTEFTDQRDYILRNSGPSDSEEYRDIWDKCEFVRECASRNSEPRLVGILRGQRDAEGETNPQEDQIGPEGTPVYRELKDLQTARHAHQLKTWAEDARLMELLEQDIVIGPRFNYLYEVVVGVERSRARAGGSSSRRVRGQQASSSRSQEQSTSLASSSRRDRSGGHSRWNLFR